MSELLSVEELADLWNGDADQYNQWDTLGLDEMVEFAQKQLNKKITKLEKAVEAAKEFHSCDVSNWAHQDRAYDNLGKALAELKEKEDE